MNNKKRQKNNIHAGSSFDDFLKEEDIFQHCQDAGAKYACDMLSEDKKEVSLKDFRRIPGVGVRIAADLWQLGFRNVSDLKNADAEQIYQDLCLLQKCHVDRCMLYVFRCAVYFASNKKHDPHLLKWWNWKDCK